MLTMVLFIYLFTIVVVLGGSTLWHYKSSYNVSNASWLNSLSPLLSFFPPTMVLNEFHFGVISHEIKEQCFLTTVLIMRKHL
jgi:hypothetical protein